VAFWAGRDGFDHYAWAIGGLARRWSWSSLRLRVTALPATFLVQER
jgi:hypothetical protein